MISCKECKQVILDANIEKRITENERLRRALDAHGPTDAAYNGTMNFQTGWDRCVFILRAAMEKK